MSGTIVGIACGTSVALFADLAMYIMRMNLARIGENTKVKGKPVQYKLFANEEFPYLKHPNFKFILFSSFKEKKHVLGELLLRAAHDISEHQQHPNFEYHLRISSEKGQPKWNAAYFAKHIPADAHKIFITGPMGAESTLTNILVDAGFNRSVIGHL